MKKSCDIVIVGAGIIGLAVARELVKRGVKRIVILEKEQTLGLHASGRNSGVLHAGLYYSSDSLKARFCSRGARAMKAYVMQKGLPILETGKVLVAADKQQLHELDVVLKRSTQNAIRVERITPERLTQIEPTAHTLEWALYSPDTAVIDSHSILEALRKDLIASGVELAVSEPALRIQSLNRQLRTPSTEWSYGHLINVAGLQADTIAHHMGVGSQYRILPFRGRFRKLSPEAAKRIHGLIYPVPDPRLPFLGVHLTKSIKGDVWVGPTAEPALGRDHYQGLGGINWREFPQLFMDLFSMTLRNASGLASHIHLELKKQLPGGLLAAAQALVPSLQASDFTKVTKTGLRAQLLDVQNKKLVMDFVVEKGPHSTHVLNAVSPGFTASFAFAEYVVDIALK